MNPPLTDDNDMTIAPHGGRRRRRTTSAPPLPLHPPRAGNNDMGRAEPPGADGGGDDDYDDDDEQIEATLIASSGGAGRTASGIGAEVFPDLGERVGHPRSFETWDVGRFVEEGGPEYHEYLGALCAGDLRRPLRIAQLQDETALGLVEFILFPLLYRGDRPGQYIVALVGIVRAPVLPAPLAPARQTGAVEEATARWIQARLQLRQYVRNWCAQVDLALGYRVSWHHRPVHAAVAPLFRAPSPLPPLPTTTHRAAAQRACCLASIQAA